MNRKILLGVILPAFALSACGNIFAAETPADAKTADSGQVAARQIQFFKKYENPDPETAAIILSGLQTWLRLNANKPSADEALDMKADMQMRLGDYKGAIATYVKYVYDYPESKQSLTVKSELITLVDKKMDRKLKNILTEIAKGYDSASKPERLAVFLKKMTEQAGELFYEPLVIEYQDFFARFPDYPKNDELEMLLGNLYLTKRLYASAIIQYEKVMAVYPDSPYTPKANRSIGDIYANSLGKYDKAIETYQSVVNRYADSDEAGFAYQQIAKLSENQKQFDLAVEVYEKIITLYPGKDAAYNAYISEAKVLRDSLKKPQEAVAVLNRLADAFKGDKAVSALNLAADIARKDLNDFNAEIANLDKIVSTYPDHIDSAKTLYRIAEIQEKDLKNLDKAVETYQKVVAQYAANSMAKSASKRIEALTKR